MAITAITSGLTNLLPVLERISALADRVQTVANRNKEASQEALVTDMLVTAGAGFGLVGSSIVRSCNHNFSLKSTFFWSLIGGLAGMAVSTPLIMSFVSQFKARESAISPRLQSTHSAHQKLE